MEESDCYFLADLDHAKSAYDDHGCAYYCAHDRASYGVHHDYDYGATRDDDPPGNAKSRVSSPGIHRKP